jgi:predicted permeases
MHFLIEVFGFFVSSILSKSMLRRQRKTAIMERVLEKKCNKRKGAVMDTFLPYLIVCPMVFMAGLIDAVAGGGGLISLPAYMIAGVPVHGAIATNKMSAAMGTVVATYRYGKSGFIHWKRALPCVVFALGGSYIGARITLLLSERSIQILMLFILPVTALYVLRGRSLDAERVPYSYGRTVLLSVLISFCIGIYDGFYGPGTGTFLLLLLTGLAHIGLTEAAGTTKVINLSTNISALVVFLLNGVVMLPLGIVAGLFSIAGNYVGTRIFTEKGTKFVKPFILVVLVIFFIKVLTELFG